MESYKLCSCIVKNWMAIAPQQWAIRSECLHRANVTPVILTLDMDQQPGHQ